MGRSRARLASDWFAKLRQNATTGIVEHTDVADVETSVATVQDSVATVQDSVASVDTTAVKQNDSPTFGTVTANAFLGDGSGLTGVGGSTTAGGVGTYAYMIVTSANIGANPGNTRAGSGLRYSAQSTNSNASGSGYSVGHTSGYSAAGTWQAMGGRTATTAYKYFATLWLRIS